VDLHHVLIAAKKKLHSQDTGEYSRVFMHMPKVFMGEETDGRLRDITGRLVRQSRDAAYGLD
jgi:hypothetical protein